MKKVRVAAGAVFALVFCFALQAFAATPAGIVLTVEQGAWVERNGQKIVLSAKDAVQVSDVLLTDGHGRVQVIFSDDTTISLGANTQVAVTDFVFDQAGTKPSFAANMVKGAARFVTGKVVEQNRDGFAVQTPQATVGIRGTTFSVNVSDKGVTTVIGLNVTKGFPISVTNVKTGEVSKIETSGFAVDAATGGNTSYQTPPGQFSQSSSAVNGTAVASSDESGNSGQTSSGSASAGGAVTAENGGSSDSGGSGFGGASDSGMAGNATNMASGASQAGGASGGTLNSTLMASEPAAAQDLANSAGKSPSEILGTAPGSGGNDHSNMTASWSGTFNNGGSPIGTFSFDTNLSAGSGTISNSSVTSTSHGGFTGTQAGAGTVSGGAFNLNHSVTSSGNPIINGGDFKMNGSITGTNTSGNWQLIQNDHSTLQDNGAFSGSKNP